MHDSQIRLKAVPAYTPSSLSPASRDARNDLRNELAEPASFTQQSGAEYTLADVADRSRAAYIALMKSAVTPFKNADLAEWFKGPYRRAVAPAALMLGRMPTPFSIARGSVDVHVDVLTLQAREEALVALRRLRSLKEQDTSFTFDARNQGHIVEWRDAAGTRGLVPVDAPDMKLYERVLALIAVDYCARPQDFEDRLAICRRCEMPFFDGIHACQRGLSIHVRKTG